MNKQYYYTPKELKHWEQINSLTKSSKDIFILTFTPKEKFKSLFDEIFKLDRKYLFNQIDATSCKFTSTYFDCNELCDDKETSTLSCSTLSNCIIGLNNIYQSKDSYVVDVIIASKFKNLDLFEEIGMILGTYADTSKDVTVAKLLPVRDNELEFTGKRYENIIINNFLYNSDKDSCDCTEDDYEDDEYEYIEEEPYSNGTAGYEFNQQYGNSSICTGSSFNTYYNRDCYYTEFHETFFEIELPAEQFVRAPVPVTKQVELIDLAKTYEVELDIKLNDSKQELFKVLKDVDEKYGVTVYDIFSRLLTFSDTNATYISKKLLNEYFKKNLNLEDIEKLLSNDAISRVDNLNDIKQTRISMLQLISNQTEKIPIQYELSKDFKNLKLLTRFNNCDPNVINNTIRVLKEIAGEVTQRITEI